MSKQCLSCKTKIYKSKAVLCVGGCSGSFHTKCAKISEELLGEIKKGSILWRCSKCQSKSADSSIIIEEVEEEIQMGIENEEINTNSQSTNHIQSSNQPCLNEAIDIGTLEPTNCTLDGMANYLKSLGALVLEIRTSQKCICLQFDEMIKFNKELVSENNILKNNVKTLNAKLLDLENKHNLLEANLDNEIQQKNKNDIVVTGLPNKIENFNDLFIKMANKINVKINPSDILNVKAIETQKKNHIDTNNKNTKCLYIVKFSSQTTKNEILLKKKKIHMFSGEFEVKQDRNMEIFFQNHLSPLQSKLYYFAKQLKIKNKIKFLWVKDNIIKIRQTENSKIFNIKNFNDINKIGQSINTE